MKKPMHIKSGSGFSLVELLVVIAVIAIIAAIAIPNIANITQSAGEATKLRNAQQLVSTYNNYAEAFYAANDAYPAGTITAETAITTLTSGAAVTNARLDTTNTFRLPGLTTNVVKMDKITVDANNKTLIYNPEL